MQLNHDTWEDVKYIVYNKPYFAERCVRLYNDTIKYAQFKMNYIHNTMNFIIETDCFDTCDETLYWAMMTINFYKNE